MDTATTNGPAATSLPSGAPPLLEHQIEGVAKLREKPRMLLADERHPCPKCGKARVPRPRKGGRVRWICHPCEAAKNRARWANDRPLQRAVAKRGKLMRNFGLTVEQRDAMIEERGGACDICGRTPERTLHVDHDHATGQIRGMLCDGCNRSLGWVDKNKPAIDRYLDGGA